GRHAGAAACEGHGKEGFETPRDDSVEAEPDGGEIRRAGDHRIAEDRDRAPVLDERARERRAPAWRRESRKRGEESGGFGNRHESAQCEGFADRATTMPANRAHVARRRRCNPPAYTARVTHDG